MQKWKIKEEGMKKKKMMHLSMVDLLLRETLNLLDNLDRSKISIENDEKLKNSDSLKKYLNI